MNPFQIIQAIKILVESGQIFRNIFKKKLLALISILMSLLVVMSIWFLYTNYSNQRANRHYYNSLRDNLIYRKIFETLSSCGSNSSVMIGAINVSQKVGIIKDFYSCNPKIKPCVSNTKETRQDYRESYVVDESTYAFLQELGSSGQVQTIDLSRGDIITPLSRSRMHISDLIALHNLVEASTWFREGKLKILKLGAVVDRNDSVIFTISFSGSDGCPLADNLIFALKEIINKSNDRNASIL